MIATPKISVVMPEYNQGKYIENALLSICDQSFNNWELIIVDDGTTDEKTGLHLANIIGCSPPGQSIKFFNKENGGTGSALNMGFEHAIGKYETWMASDNVLYPIALLHLNNFLDAYPDVDFVYSACDVVVMEGDNCAKRYSIKKELGNMQWDAFKYYEKPNIGFIWLWRKELRLKAGGHFMLAPNETYDMFIRMIEAGGKFAFLDQSLGYYRRHSENLSAKMLKSNPDYTKNLIKQMCERRDIRIK